MSKSKIINQDLFQKVIRELYLIGKTNLEIAYILGISESTVRRIIARLKLTKQLPKIKPKQNLELVELEKYKVEWVPIKRRAKNKNKKEKPFKSYLVVSDLHIPYENREAIKAILRLMEDYLFDGFIILGDFMDMTPISHWLKNKHKSLEKLRMKEHYLKGNVILDEFDKRLSKSCDKRFFYGNHERFYYDMIEEQPVLEGYFEPKTELKLKERGYVIYDDINHIERIGRLSLTHGMYHSVNFIKKHIDEFKTNVLIGHLHSPRMRFEASPAKQIEIAGYCIGCLCNKNPAYLQNKPHKWAHGFAVVYFYSNGFFDVDLKRIVQGRFIFNGKIYDGSK